MQAWLLITSPKSQNPDLQPPQFIEYRLSDLMPMKEVEEGANHLKHEVGQQASRAAQHALRGETYYQGQSGFKALADSTINAVPAHFNKGKKRLDNLHKHKSHEIESFKMQERVGHYDVQLAPEKNEKLKPHEQQIVHSKDKQNSLNDQIAKKKHAILDYEVRKNGGCPITRTSRFQKPEIYASTSVILSASDVAFMYNAIQHHADSSNVLALMSCLFLCAGVAINSDWAGRALDSGKQKLIKFALASASLFTLFQVALRLEVSSNIMFITPILIMVAAIYIAYCHAKDMPYFNLVEQLAKSEVELSNEKNKENSAKIAIQTIKDTYEATAKEKAKSDLKTLEQEKLSFEVFQCDLESEHELHIQKLKSIYEEGVIAYSRSYASASACRTKENGQDKHTQENGRRTGFRSLLIGFSIGLTSLFTACNDTPANTCSVGIVIDTTDTTSQLEPDALVKYYQTLTELDVQNLGNIDASVLITTVDDTHLTGMNYIHYPAPASYFLRVEEKEKQRVRQHLDSIRNIVSRISKGITPKSRSYIAESICNLAEAVSNTGATTKHVIIFSDLLVNTSGLNVYKVSSLSKSHKVKDKVVAYLNNACSLDLSGIHVTIVHKPDPAGTERYRFVQDCFREWFTSHGAASLKFIANL